MRNLVVFLAAGLVLAADGPGVLQIQVMDGADAVYPLGSRATRGVTPAICGRAGKGEASGETASDMPQAPSARGHSLQPPESLAMGTRRAVVFS